MRTVRQKLLALLLLILSGALPHVALAQFRTNNSLVFLDNAQAITATIKASKEQVCKGETPQPTITFTATGGIAPYTFTYTENGTRKKITTTGTNSSVSFNLSTNNTGTFTYSLDSVASHLETAEAVTGQQATIKINEPPTVDFSFADNQCSGATVKFTSNISGGTAPYTYYWDFGNGNTSTQPNPEFTFSSYGCGTINLPTNYIVTGKQIGRAHV